MLTNTIEIGADGRAVGSRDVRIRILGGEEKKPLAGLELSVGYGVLGSKNVLTATTEDDGGASFRLAQGFHLVRFTSPRELPYLPFKTPDEYRRRDSRMIYVHETQGEQTFDLTLADPCELVLRAVDADTNDLTVTTTLSVKVGDTLLVTGEVHVDKDFGHGYRYEVILEDAQVTVE